MKNKALKLKSVVLNSTGEFRHHYNVKFEILHLATVLINFLVLLKNNLSKK